MCAVNLRCTFFLQRISRTLDCLHEMLERRKVQICWRKKMMKKKQASKSINATVCTAHTHSLAHSKYTISMVCQLQYHDSHVALRFSFSNQRIETGGRTIFFHQSQTTYSISFHSWKVRMKRSKATNKNWVQLEFISLTNFQTPNQCAL